jgi:hypothetical protein
MNQEQRSDCWEDLQRSGRRTRIANLRRRLRAALTVVEFVAKELEALLHEEAAS